MLLAGDLVEESGPPAYGVDCYPMDWPVTLDLVLGLVGRDTVVVPGHGALVDRDFVEQQRQDIAIAAQTIRDLAAARRTPRPRAGRGRVALPRRRTSRTPSAAATPQLPPGGRGLPMA